MDQSDNLANEAGTDKVTPQANDTAEDWDYFDPDEKQDTEAAPETEATDDGTAEAEEVTETAETEEAQPEEIEAAEDAVVTLADGEKVKVKDLANGYLRQADYTRKSQEVATQRNAVKADVERFTRINDTFVEFLSAQIPAAPDLALAASNPSLYVSQKAQHEAALAKVQELIAMADEPKAVAEGMSKADKEAMLQEQNLLLAQRFPETAQKEGRTKFFNEVADAAEKIGFTMDELSQVTDHRIFALAKLAAVGMKAEAARAKVATKVANAPPVAPKRPGQGAQPANRNAEAMQRLNRTGSIRDAAKVDWD